VWQLIPAAINIPDRFYGGHLHRQGHGRPYPAAPQR
jgi:hypothetical protein